MRASKLHWAQFRLGAALSYDIGYSLRNCPPKPVVLSRFFSHRSREVVPLEPIRMARLFRWASPLFLGGVTGLRGRGQSALNKSQLLHL